jgi:hypothetical protein
MFQIIIYTDVGHVRGVRKGDIVQVYALKMKLPQRVFKL